MVGCLPYSSLLYSLTFLWRCLRSSVGVSRISNYSLIFLLTITIQQNFGLKKNKSLHSKTSTVLCYFVNLGNWNFKLETCHTFLGGDLNTQGCSNWNLAGNFIPFYLGIRCCPKIWPTWNLPLKKCWTPHNFFKGGKKHIKNTWKMQHVFFPHSFGWYLLAFFLFVCSLFVFNFKGVKKNREKTTPCLGSTPLVSPPLVTNPPCDQPSSLRWGLRGAWCLGHFCQKASKLGHPGVAAGACCDCLKMLADQAREGMVEGQVELVGVWGWCEFTVYAVAQLKGDGLPYHRKCYSKIVPWLSNDVFMSVRWFSHDIIALYEYIFLYFSHSWFTFLFMSHTMSLLTTIQKTPRSWKEKTSSASSVIQESIRSYQYELWLPVA